MKRLMVCLIGLQSWNATAAIPKPVVSESNDAQMVLQLPLDNRVKIFKAQGAEALQDLSAVAFDEKAPLIERWRALTVIGRVFPKDGQKILERALSSREWYLRNAAAVGLRYNARPWAIKWARILMHDSALVVRTSAVETLQVMGAIEAEDLLWEKLYAPENYSKGQSLWVRKHIAEALSQFARRGQEAAFKKLLVDADASLHPIAVKALNRLSGTEKNRAAWLN